MMLQKSVVLGVKGGFVGIVWWDFEKGRGRGSAVFGSDAESKPDQPKAKSRLQENVFSWHPGRCEGILCTVCLHSSSRAVRSPLSLRFPGRQRVRW